MDTLLPAATCVLVGLFSIPRVKSILRTVHIFFQERIYFLYFKADFNLAVTEGLNGGVANTVHG